MSQSENAANMAERQTAMRALSMAAEDELEALYDTFEPKPDWHFARRPETGLVMARGRIGGGGAPFNLGEVTITRAAVTLESGETGYSWCQGRGQRKAAIAAFFDAAWLKSDLRARVEAEIVVPLAQNQAKADTVSQQATASTKVDFFTLVRGDD